MDIDDGGRKVSVKPGDKIFVSFVSMLLIPRTPPSSLTGSQVGAARNPDVFPSPDEVKTDRPLNSYIHYGEGPHACLGKDASRVSITAMMKVVGSLDNLRRAPGPQGQLKKIPRPGGFYIFMRADHGSYWPFPVSKCSEVSPTLSVGVAEKAANTLTCLLSYENQLGRRAATAEEAVRGQCTNQGVVWA